MSHLSNYRFSPSQRRLPWLAALVTLLAASTTAGAGAQELADSLACDPLAGVEALDLKPGTVLLLGELHGTAEAPALVADLACRALRQGLPLRVGLELPQRDTEATETYLASVGEADDRARLLAGELWRRPYQDGRSSQAMADLIEELRRFKAAAALQSGRPSLGSSGIAPWRSTSPRPPAAIPRTSCSC